MSKEICFIINPVSGTGKWKGIEKSIKDYLDPSFTPKILYTEYPGHATLLAKDASATSVAVVAVGGDGIMNEVAKGIMGSSALLGIVPTGSGNALARHLNIPISQKGSIECINKMHSRVIDTATMNHEDFVAVCGTGFDAEVANKFAQSSKRGFFTYLWLAASNYFKYKPAEYDIIVDGKAYKERAFLISVANSSQYGNNAHIAPQASTRDGMLDVCILKPFPLVIAPILIFRLFGWSLDRSPYMETIRGRSIIIRNADRHTQLCIHYDGEPGGTTDEMRIEVAPRTLRVIVPEE
ncbi:MAG: diacylglycerol/lipid kinase family protein [Bacteroidia bacterium]